MIPAAGWAKGLGSSSRVIPSESMPVARRSGSRATDATRTVSVASPATCWCTK
jgi:hypothetical protein